LPENLLHYKHLEKRRISTEEGQMHQRPKRHMPELVHIPAGPFLMGSQPEQTRACEAQFRLTTGTCDNELPQRQVDLPAFQISRGPISCIQYHAFIIATSHPTPGYWFENAPPSKVLHHPVVGVSLDDALYYCRWLSEATGTPYGLPTEQQWEKAARGTDGRQYPWGDTWNPLACNTAEKGPGTTSIIGSYPHDVSPYGCVDMAGNVAEWTMSHATPEASTVIVRGGRWSSSGNLARCARRTTGNPQATSLGCGFRIVCLVEDGEQPPGE
jgi:formylglycine-generating enzyme required for sulfatase activity